MFIISVLFVVTIPHRFSSGVKTETRSSVATCADLAAIPETITSLIAQEIQKIAEEKRPAQVMAVSHSVAWVPADALVAAKG